MRKSLFTCLLVASFFALACDSDPVSRMEPSPDAGTPPQTTDASEGSEDATTSPPDAELADAGANEEADAADLSDSGTIAPPAEPPPLREYSGGNCPLLTHGTTSEAAINVGFPSAGVMRSFRLLVPSTYDPNTPTPVVFGWHWLNASSGSFVREAEMESAIEEMGFIAVLPDRREKANGDKEYFFDWPFVETNQAEGDLVFFDDLLACLSEQFNVDRRRVYGIGVSAGALWLTYMMSTDRVDYFAAVESLSGGLGEVAGTWQMTFTPRAYKFPAIVLWGGPSDRLGVNFAEASMRLEGALLANGHFVVECVHANGHQVPPIEAPMGSSTRFWSLWRFMLDHPYGAVSSYPKSGLPVGFPSWCRIP